MYSHRFFRDQSPGSLSSAEVLVPLIMELFHPRSVVDVGCGTGTWLSVYRAAGCEVLGIDGSWVRAEDLSIPATLFRCHDLTQPLRLPQRFDLAMSQEVAEHLPDSAAPTLVESLTKLAPVVVFSAAIPGQTGERHVNCQWADYWVSIFERFGFSCCDALRRRVWDDPRIAVWYRSNVLVFADGERIEQVRRASGCTADDRMFAIVHPEWYSLYADPGQVNSRLWLRMAPYAVQKGLRSLLRRMTRRTRRPVDPGAPPRGIPVRPNT